jgi:hypothetical protein
MDTAATALAYQTHTLAVNIEEEILVLPFYKLYTNILDLPMENEDKYRDTRIVQTT